MTRWFLHAPAVLVAALLVIGSGCGKDSPRPTPPASDTAPTAAFTVSPDSGTTATVFRFDATGSFDAEDSLSALEVRWDFEENGTWDTEYSRVKVAEHQYGTVGTWKVQVEVRDSGGLTDTTTREVAIGAAPVVGEEFVLVPAGTYTMGSPVDEPGRDLEETPHEVTLTRPLYVSWLEVTQDQWASVMGWDESTFDGPNRPVEQVTWFDALMYCNACSHRDGLRPAYTITDVARDSVHVTGATVLWDPDADGYRLLTESEWEYVARAGSTTAFCNGPITNIHCADPLLDEVGWYCGDTASGTRDVGGKAGNAWDLRDMHGNVWEWCWDWYAVAYPDGPVTDPRGPATGTQRVIRGGSWDHRAGDCRSAARGVLAPGSRGSVVGFRLARAAN